MVKRPDETDPGRLESKAKALFDARVERLDARTRSRLSRARNHALEELENGSPLQRWLRVPLAGLAGAVLMAVVVSFWARGGRAPAVPLDDLEIVADADRLELLQDVDFYAWLDAR